MNITLIYNAKSSSHSPRFVEYAQEELGKEHNVTVECTAEQGHAEELARVAAANHCELVVVLSGDGTLNEAANGLIGTNCALAALPGGSTNVFARTLGFSNDVVAATDQLRSAIALNKTLRVGLGNANDRRFLFHVGVGFDAAVVEKVERNGKWKRYAGHSFILLNSIYTWTQYATEPAPLLHIHAGEREYAGTAAIFMNSDPYTFLGDIPLTISPGLLFEDCLSLFRVESIRKPSFMMSILSALVHNSRLRKRSGTDLVRNIKEGVITSDVPFPYQMDGEFLGETSTLHVTYEPDALTVYALAKPRRRHRLNWGHATAQ